MKNLSPNTWLVGISEWWNEIMDRQSAAVCLVALFTGRWCYEERASHFVSRALNVKAKRGTAAQKVTPLSVSMHVDVNAGWKVHSLLRRSNKTQNTLLDYFGSFEEANRFIAFVHEYINRDAVIRHQMEKESVLSRALPCAARPPTSLLLCKYAVPIFPNAIFDTFPSLVQ